MIHIKYTCQYVSALFLVLNLLIIANNKAAKPISHRLQGDFIEGGKECFEIYLKLHQNKNLIDVLKTSK